MSPEALDQSESVWLESSRQDRIDAVIATYMDHLEAGGDPDPSPWLLQHPELQPELAEFLGNYQWVRRDLAAIPAPGEILDDRYRLIRLIGTGGNGLVYEAELVEAPTSRSADPEREGLHGAEAEDGDRSRRRALKVIPSRGLSAPTDLARFRRGIAALSELDHPGIVAVEDWAVRESYCYVVMPQVDGHDLRTIIRKLRWAAEQVQTAENASSERYWVATGEEPSSSRLLDLDGPSRWSAVAWLGVQAARALAYANARGVLHRDIKPSNLMLDAEGRVLLTDFDLAKSGLETEVTASQEWVGTLRYMAPERFSGWCDRRSEVYGLGLVLYELLTLRPAFSEGTGAELMGQVLRGKLVRPRRVDPSIPKGLESIVLRATSSEPLDRYADAGSLAADLERFLADQPLEASRRLGVRRAWGLARRYPLVVGLAGLLLISLAAGAITSTVLWRQAVRESERKLEAISLSRDRLRNVLEVVASLDSSEIQEYLLRQPDSSRAREDFGRQLLELTESIEQASEAGQRLETPEEFLTRGEILVIVGGIYDEWDRDEEALATLNRARDLFQIRLNDPDRDRHGPEVVARLRAGLAEVQGTRGQLLDQVGRFDEAEQAHREAARMIAQLPADRILQGIDLDELFCFCKSLDAMHHYVTHQPTKSSRLMREVLQRVRTVAEPSDSLLTRGGDAAVFLANIEQRAGNLRSALDLATETIDLIDRLSQSKSVSQGVLRTRVQALQIQGRSLIDLKQPDEALVPLGVARSQIETMMKARPHNPWYRDLHAITLIIMGVAKRDLGDLDEAFVVIDEAIQVGLELVEQEPKGLEFRLRVCEGYGHLIEVLLKLKRPQEALQASDAELVALKDLRQIAGGSEYYLRVGGLSHARRVKAAYALGNWDVILEALPHADAKPLGGREMVETRRIEALIGLGRFDEAFAEIVHVIEVSSESAMRYYNMACLMVRAETSRLWTESGQIDPTQAEAERLDQALSWLEHAAELGFFKSSSDYRMQPVTDLDLELLRRSSDHRERLLGLVDREPASEPDSE